MGLVEGPRDHRKVSLSCRASSCGKLASPDSIVGLPSSIRSISEWHSVATLSELFACSSQFLSHVFTVLVKAYKLVLFLLDFGLEVCITTLQLLCMLNQR